MFQTTNQICSIVFTFGMLRLGAAVLDSWTACNSNSMQVMLNSVSVMKRSFQMYDLIPSIWERFTPTLYGDLGHGYYCYIHIYSNHSKKHIKIGWPISRNHSMLNTSKDISALKTFQFLSPKSAESKADIGVELDS